MTFQKAGLSKLQLLSYYDSEGLVGTGSGSSVIIIQEMMIGD